MRDHRRKLRRPCRIGGEVGTVPREVESWNTWENNDANTDIRDDHHTGAPGADVPAAVAADRGTATNEIDLEYLRLEAPEFGQRSGNRWFADFCMTPRVPQRSSQPRHQCPAAKDKSKTSEPWPENITYNLSDRAAGSSGRSGRDLKETPRFGVIRAGNGNHTKTAGNPRMSGSIDDRKHADLAASGQLHGRSTQRQADFHILGAL